jgi:hypothetical protein
MESVPLSEAKELHHRVSGKWGDLRREREEQNDLAMAAQLQAGDYVSFENGKGGGGTRIYGRVQGVHGRNVVVESLSSPVYGYPGVDGATVAARLLWIHCSGGENDD